MPRKRKADTAAATLMALAVAWQYFNAVAEPGNDFAKTFLLLTPNVIVSF